MMRCAVGSRSNRWQRTPANKSSSWQEEFSIGPRCNPRLAFGAKSRVEPSTALEQPLPARENKVAMRTTETIWRSLIRTAPGCILIAVITYVCYRLRLNLTITGFGYLIVVVLQSLFGSFASSATVSVLAVLCLDFFFTPPLFSFEVTNPLDVLALISFLITGLVITRLNTKVRKEAAISDRQRHQVDRLYQLAQKLLALNPETTTCSTSAELFQ